MKQYCVKRGISSDLNGARFEAGMTVPSATIDGAFSPDTIGHWIKCGVLTVVDMQKPKGKKAVSNGEIG